MKDLNIIKWGEFQVGEIFEFKRGKRLVKNIQIYGDINYISSTKNNNGIDNEILPPEFMKIYENKLTLSNSGSVGYCFYQKEKFVSSDHCTVIWFKDRNIQLNKYLGLFLKPIFEKIRIKYNFGREINNKRLKNEWIQLPINKENKPDFEYMENYIKTISKKIMYNKDLIFKNTNLLNKAKFKEFQITELFEIQKGERLIKTDRIKGEIPLITASSKNNGLVNFLDLKTYENKKKLFSNVITIDMFFNVFYQKDNFFADDNIHCLSFKNNYKLNKYISLFIISCFKKIQKKYGFGRQVRFKRLPYEYIKLPVNKNNEIDFNFMEKYIKSLPYSKYI